MIHYNVYLSPRKQGDNPVETFDYEPSSVMIELLAQKHGNIIIVNSYDTEEDKPESIRQQSKPSAGAETLETYK